MKRKGQYVLHKICYEGYPESNLRFGIKRNPSERKHFLLYTFESHKLELFFNIVAVQIEALIITVHKLINSIVIEFCRLRLQPLIHACRQFRVVVEALRCESGLHVWKQVVVARRKIRTVRRMIKHLRSKMIQELSSAIGRVRASVV